MSYYMLNGFGAADSPKRYGKRPMHGLGELFFDGGKAFWTVKPGGEIVSKIAQAVYGDAGKWVDICKANPQNRDPKQPPGDCWYKPGAVLTLPLIPGYPDPAAAAPKSGLPVAQSGQTIVTPEGKVATVGEGGVIAGGLAKAGLSTGMLLGIGAAVVVGVGLLALTAKKKPAQGGQPSRAAA